MKLWNWIYGKYFPSCLNSYAYYLRTVVKFVKQWDEEEPVYHVEETASKIELVMGRKGKGQTDKYNFHPKNCRYFLLLFFGLVNYAGNIRRRRRRTHTQKHAHTQRFFLFTITDRAMRRCCCYVFIGFCFLFLLICTHFKQCGNGEQYNEWQCKFWSPPSGGSRAVAKHRIYMRRARNCRSSRRFSLTWVADFHFITRLGRQWLRWLSESG